MERRLFTSRRLSTEMACPKNNSAADAVFIGPKLLFGGAKSVLGHLYPALAV